MIEPAFGHAIARIRRQRLLGAVGEQHPLDREKGGAAGDGAEIVRVADAVEDQHRLSVPGPAGRRRRVERGERPRPGDRGDAAMQQGAGDARQFGCLQFAVGFAGAGEQRTKPADLAAQTGIEEQPFDTAGIGFEQRPDRGEPAHPQQGALVQPPAAAYPAVFVLTGQVLAVARGAHCDVAPAAA